MWARVTSLRSSRWYQARLTVLDAYGGPVMLPLPTRPTAAFVNEADVTVSHGIRATDRFTFRAAAFSDAEAAGMLAAELVEHYGDLLVTWAPAPETFERWWKVSVAADVIGNDVATAVANTTAPHPPALMMATEMGHAVARMLVPHMR